MDPIIRYYIGPPRLFIATISYSPYDMTGTSRRDMREGRDSGDLMKVGAAWMKTLQHQIVK